MLLRWFSLGFLKPQIPYKKLRCHTGAGRAMITKSLGRGIGTEEGLNARECRRALSRGPSGVECVNALSLVCGRRNGFEQSCSSLSATVGVPSGEMGSWIFLSKPVLGVGEHIHTPCCILSWYCAK